MLTTVSHPIAQYIAATASLQAARHTTRQRPFSFLRFLLGRDASNARQHARRVFAS